MISTKNPSSLPDKDNLQRICKAISVLDSIISQEWQFRYYSYNSKWSENEECLQMRNGSGDEIHILFLDKGCAINGFAHEFEEKDKTKLTKNLPEIFDEFIFGEPVESIGTTFCLWITESKDWKVGELENHNDNSEEMLCIFDGNPKTYCDWAEEYFEINVPVDIATKIYNGETLTKEDVLLIVGELDDWQRLENDLKEIKYPYNFNILGEKSKWKFW